MKTQYSHNQYTPLNLLHVCTCWKTVPDQNLYHKYHQHSAREQKKRIKLTSGFHVCPLINHEMHHNMLRFAIIELHNYAHMLCEMYTTYIIPKPHYSYDLFMRTSYSHNQQT